MSDLIEQCPKFATCNAPICPLDDHWRESRHLSGERVCLWLREASKQGGKARVCEALPRELSEPVLVALREITHAGATLPHGVGLIRSRLKDAAASGSKLDSGKRLREVAHV